MDLPQKTFQDGIDPDFIWEEYLETTNSVPGPPEAFTHVEYSLESGFKVGMKLEVPNPDHENSYWLASVVMTCGELLSLRYAGYDDDRSADFWFNIKSGEFHPVGWCAVNDRKLWPPKGVLQRHPDISLLLAEELKKMESIPASLSEDLDAGFIPIDQIKCGMKVEVADDFDPDNIWIATIIHNVGGRLLLRYDQPSHSSSEDFWLFYLCHRIYPIGYAKEHNMKYRAPRALRNKHTEDEWNTLLKESLKEAENFPFPAHVLQPKFPLEKHEFQVGMKVEAVDPSNYKNICPATVSSVLNDYYFLVTIDSYEEEEKRLLCCNSNSQFIFPVKWAEENGLSLTPPKGYEVNESTFSWGTYLKFCNASAAPIEIFSMYSMNMGFKNGMKLEAVDPLNPNNINVATIENIVEPLMWLQYDSDNDKENRSVITGINSFDIYPVGWCASNCYPLHTPSTHGPKSESCNVSVEAEIKKEANCIQPSIQVTSQEQHCKSWCPKIYFNHRCFTGPLLSKSRLAELPQAIGPGPVNLVMNEVITRVVNIAYKSSRVLQILQVDGSPPPGMQHQVIKAKYKGKAYTAKIEVIRHSEQVEEYCKKICVMLECCPYLFGPKHVGEVCPSNCYTQTKTKFGYNFVKKHKKPGRPPLPSTLAALNKNEVIKRGPGRKKKRKHWTHLHNSVGEGAQEKPTKNIDSKENEEDPPGNVPKDETIKSDSTKTESVKNVNVAQPTKIGLVGKKKLKHTPCSNIVTRGAKLPNFGLWHHISFHSRRGRPRTRPIRPFPARKVGRPLGSTKKAIAAQINSKKDSVNGTVHVKIEEEKVFPSLRKTSYLKSNPVQWSVEEVVKYIKETNCAPLANMLGKNKIDGQALLLLTLDNVKRFLHLKPEPAEKLCYLIQDIKMEYFMYFSNT